VNPVTRVRVWSLSSRNDGALLQRAGVLGGIDTTEDDSTIWRLPASQVKRESATVGDTLCGKGINDDWVTSQLNTRTNTHQTNWKIAARGGDTKLLTSDSCASKSEDIRIVVDVRGTLSILESGDLLVVQSSR